MHIPSFSKVINLTASDLALSSGSEYERSVQFAIASAAVSDVVVNHETITPLGSVDCGDAGSLILFGVSDYHNKELPEQVPGTVLIVNRSVADANPDRSDLVVAVDAGGGKHYLLLTNIRTAAEEPITEAPEEEDEPDHSGMVVNL
jgi:hypothetical protein